MPAIAPAASRREIHDRRWLVLLRLRSDRARSRDLRNCRVCRLQRALAQLNRHIAEMGPLWAPCRIGAGIVSKTRAAWAERKLVAASRGNDLSPNVQIATLSGNIPLQGHFSAHGMPHRPCVIFVACGFHAAGCPLATSVPFVVPLVGGWGSLLRKSGPCPQHGDRVLPSK
jgi:hypothetical protein